MTCNSPEPDRVVLEIRWGQLTGDLAVLLDKAILEGGPGQPIAAWAEPTVGDPSNFQQFAVPGKRPFKGFYSERDFPEMITQVRSAHIDECRFFYPKAVLHLLREKETWRTVLVSETGAPLPSWAQALAGNVSEPAAFEKSGEPVFIYTDRNSQEKWRLIQYSHPGTQVTLFWRLIHEQE